jgi:hypothetical protein
MYKKKNIIDVTNINLQMENYATTFVNHSKDTQKLTLIDIFKIADEIKFLQQLPFSINNYLGDPKLIVKNMNGKVKKELCEHGYNLEFCHRNISAQQIKIDFDAKEILFGSYNINGAYRAYVKKF